MCGLVAEHPSCKHKVPGLIPGGGMPVRANSVTSSAAPARPEELVVAALAKACRQYHQY